MRTANWLACFFAAALAGCSLYPIPDDVISFNTEDIVLHARCEIGSAIVHYMMEQKLIPASATADEITKRVKGAEARAKQLKKSQDDLLIDDYIRKLPPDQREDAKKLSRERLAAELRAQLTEEERDALAAKIVAKLTEKDKGILLLVNVSIAYNFDFNITENNKADGGAAFQLPFTTPKVFDLGATASVNLTRQGQRQFSAGDRWGDLITQPKCAGGWPRHQNILYPFDGSIGVGRIVSTFIDISDQGGAKDSFVDTLVFTTQVAAGANAAIKLEAVPHSFRLVSAAAGLNSSRLDIHKMVVSLAFPNRDRPAAITGVERFAGDLNAPFDRPSDWRARYNLCVMDARQREDAFKKLRLEAPEVYCIKYADAFAPQFGPKKQQPVTVTLAAQPVQPSQPRGLRGTRAPQQLMTPAPVFVAPITGGVGRRPNWGPSD